MIILQILKIIGIVLLCLLGLIFLILLAVLFVPVRYKANIERKSENSLKARINVSYLIHLVSLLAVYESGELVVKLKILGICFKKSVKDFNKDSKVNETESDEDKASKEEYKDSKKDGEVKASFNDDKSEVISEEPEYTIDWNEDSENITEYKEESSVKKKDIDNKSEENKTAEDGHQNSKQIKTDSSRGFTDIAGGLIEKLLDIPDRVLEWIDIILGLVNKTDDKIDLFVRKIESISKKYARFDRLFNDSKNKRAMSKLWNYGRKCLTWIKPYRINGHLDFGFGDEFPDITADCIAILSMIPKVSKGNFEIYPFFDSYRFDLAMYLKGKIVLYKYVGLVIALFLDKDIRRLYRMYRQK